MYKDEIVDEVRKARDDFARLYDYDISRIYDAIRVRQSESPRPVVSRVTRKRKLHNNVSIDHELESVR